MKAPMLVLLLMLLAGCEEATHDLYAEVQSDTSWSGIFGNRTVDGVGNQTVDLPDVEAQCVIVSKETDNGYLTLTVWNHVTGGSVMGVGSKDDHEHGESVTTTARRGIVTACSEWGEEEEPDDPYDE